MEQQKPRWFFWIAWVSINSIASLFWALILEQSVEYLAGIFIGVTCFIIFYAQLDHYFSRKNLLKAQRALVLGVYIKAGLQILNLVPFFSISFTTSPEIIAGSLALMAAESVGAALASFPGALIATLITGTLLSIMVGVLSIIVSTMINLNRSHNKK